MNVRGQDRSEVFGTGFYTHALECYHANLKRVYCVFKGYSLILKGFVVC